MKIDYNKHAVEFLKEHGWIEVEDMPGYLVHNLFPLAEDISSKGMALAFVENFYGKAWEGYKAMMDYYNKFYEAKE